MANNQPPANNLGGDAPVPLPARVMTLLRRAGNDITGRDPRAPFAEVMREALYGPGGYYRMGSGQHVGKDGDFFTSVSVGPLFGQLLAGHCRELWQALGRPARFSLVEQGADNGRLMADIVAAASRLDPALAQALVPFTIEPLAELAELQRSTVGKQLQSVGSPKELPADLAPGLFYCNELVDALPVCRVRQEHAGEWRELHLTREGFRWLEPATPGLAEELGRLASCHALPEAYETEVHLEARGWMRALAESPFTGHVLVIDYGFLEDDYYHPDRTCGTLQAYRDHRKVEIEPAILGEVDLTAHVNFSALLEEALAGGMAFLGLPSQEALLTRLARDWLLEIESTVDHPDRGQSPHPPGEVAGLLRQFQTLTHPGMLGRKFHALGLWKAPSGSSGDEALNSPPVLSALAGGPSADELLRAAPRT